MCCKNQVKYVKEKCNERLNIIKVLSHSSWKIDKNTLLQLYKSLVRSLIEYSLFMYPLLSITNKKTLQAIQNNALRIIFKKSIDTKVAELHSIGLIETLEERSHNLKVKYLNTAEINNNPLIKDLREDFELFKLSNHNKNIKTLLD